MTNSLIPVTELPPLPDGSDPTYLHYLDYARYEVPVGQATGRGYRIVRTDNKGNIVGGLSFANRVSAMEYDIPHRSLSGMGFNYWEDYNVAVNYMASLPAPPVGENWELHSVTGIPMAKNPLHREGNVMEDMLIDSEPIIRIHR